MDEKLLRESGCKLTLGIIYGVAMGYGFPLHLSLIGDAVSERLRPKATAMIWFLMSVCFFISPVITGYLAATFSFAGAFRIVMGFIIVAAPFVHKSFVKASGLWAGSGDLVKSG